MHTHLTVSLGNLGYDLRNEIVKSKDVIYLKSYFQAGYAV